MEINIEKLKMFFEKKLDVIGFLVRMESYNVVMRRTKS